MAVEPDGVGAKGVGLNDGGAGLQVFAVHLADDLGLGNVELVVAAIDEDAAAVEHGSHGAVTENGTGDGAGLRLEQARDPVL